MCFCSHLGFDVFRILSLAISFLAGLPGILCLFQVHIFFHRDCNDLPGLSSLARLRSPWSNIQQLGQEYSLLYLQRVLKIYCLFCAAQVKPDDHTKYVLDAKMGIKHSVEMWSLCGHEGERKTLEYHQCNVLYYYRFYFWSPKLDKVMRNYVWYVYCS